MPPRRRPTDPAHALWPAALLAMVSCGSAGGSSGTSPIIGADVEPELLACRSRVGNEMSFTEIALRTAQNLGVDRIADRAGIERRVDLHPDGNTIVFARERGTSDPASRELYTAVIDGSRDELRLTLDSWLDDEPCWSPDGDSILYASERAGSKSLWLCDADGGNPRIFLQPTAGTTDGEADWSEATDRVVFSRQESDGTHRLWLVQGNGAGLLPFTYGGGSGAEFGDRDPAFAPDGNTVIFARHGPAGTAALCTADVATGAVTTLHLTTGAIGLPRYSPVADRIYFGLAEPDAGRATLRLAVLPVAGGEATLVWPDERYQLEGLALLPTLPSAPAVAAPVPLDVNEAEIQIAWGYPTGSAMRSFLAHEDGDEFTLRTRTTSNREVAGINCVFRLPVEDPLEVVELRARAIARIDRIGDDSALRMSIYNPVERRFDTAAERIPQSTAAHTMTFDTTSLRHVSREREVRITVIGDIEPGDASELHVDLVELILVTRAPTGP